MNFSAVVGQQAMKDKLLTSVHSGRVPHAQLFLGGSGSGNLALALAYAGYLLCRNPTENDRCGQCDACRKVDSLTHPDLHFTFPFPSTTGDTCTDVYPQWRKALIRNQYLDYASWMGELASENKQGNIPVKECHAILKNLSLKAYDGNYKILLLWLPEFLGNEGNILLKLLEEPPEKTLFLLVCNNQDRLLSTIISRTQIIRIPPVDEEAIAAHLTSREGASNEEAARIAMMSGGDLVKALELLQNTENPYLDAFRNWMGYCYKRNLHMASKWADEFSGSGREHIKGFLRYGLEIIRAITVMEYLGERNGLSEKEKEFVSKLGSLLSPVKMVRIYDWFNDAAYEIERNGNAKMIFTELSFKITRLFI